MHTITATLQTYLRTHAARWREQGVRAGRAGLSRLRFALFWAGVGTALFIALTLAGSACGLFLTGFVRACARSFSPDALYVLGPLMLGAATISVIGQINPESVRRIAGQFDRLWRAAQQPPRPDPLSGEVAIVYNHHTDPALFGMISGPLLTGGLSHLCFAPAATTAALRGETAPSAILLTSLLLSVGLGAVTWRLLSGRPSEESARRAVWWAARGSLAVAVVTLLATLAVFAVSRGELSLTGAEGALVPPLLWAMFLLPSGRSAEVSESNPERQAITS